MTGDRAMKLTLMQHRKGCRNFKMGLMITSMVTGLIMIKACRMVANRCRPVKA